MKVIVSVQAKRASSRGLVHYIAHSKTDAEREAGGREIFGEYADRFEVEKANDFLKNGTARTRPANEELHHLVISFRAEDYDRLGRDEKERQQSLKEITRHMLKRLEESVGAERLAWAAGIHRNTGNPHIHIAIQKEYFDKNLEQKTLSKIPAALLPHYEKSGEEKTFAPGILIDAAGEKLDEILSAKEKGRQSSAQSLEQHESQDRSANIPKDKNQNLRALESDYQKSKPLAEKIRENCRRENRKLPAPNLSREELKMLQVASLEKRDVRAANYFERVRAELARERDEPTQTIDEIRRLKALRVVSELKVGIGEKQLKDLETRKRVFPVEVDNKKWSLAKADSLIETAREKEQKIFGKITKVLGKIGLTEENKTVRKLEKIKEIIIQKLADKSEEMSLELNSDISILKTLNEFYERETNPGKEALEPKFTAAELAEVESFAFDLKRTDVYEENWRQQKQFIESTDGKSTNGAASINEMKNKIIAGRAIAREILCETELNRAKEEYKLFKKQKDFQKFEIENKKTGETKLVSLSEVRFDSRGSIFDQTLEYFTENREKRRTRNEIEKRIKVKQLELKENLGGVKSLLRAVHDAALEYQTKSFFGASQYLQSPLFTPKELLTTELRTKDTLQKSEAVKLQKILNLADYEKSENLSEILLNFSARREHLKGRLLPI